MNKDKLLAQSGLSPPLRPYQAEALDIMKRSEGTSGLLVIATGLGKTRIFTEYIRSEVQENDHRCLILSHREELVYQPLEYLKDFSCGVELAKKSAHGEKIVSASVQSLVGRLHNYNPYEMDVIIVDEAHHAAAVTYRKILDYFKSATVFGFTATAHRGDGVALGCVFDELLYERNTLWGIQHGYLTPISCRQVKLKYDMGSVKITEEGDYSQADVARVMSGTAAGVVEAYEKYANGQTIIFAASVEEAEDITTLLNRRHGKKTAALITGKTKHRAGLLNAFECGWLKVLVNFSVLTEGVDTRCAATILIARPIAPTNVGLYAQMVGRGLRLYPGKEACTVIDCVGISDSPICTAATLIGKEPPAAKPEKAPTKAELKETESLTVLTGSEIPDTWITGEIKEIDIMNKGIGADMHNLAFTEIKSGGYILSIPNVTYRISKPLADGTVYLYKNRKCSKNPAPLQFVVDYIYQDLTQKHAGARHIWDKEQRRFWDNQKITDQQIRLIHSLAPSCKVDTQQMTRGDASKLIQDLQYTRETEGSDV